jgi:UDP-2,4-diacetamido-2,4,6-trideoxy-beta-L-altropyranose hydrolase
LTAARVAVRADATLQIGAGHVMRCLSLADALVRRGARVRFVCRGLPSAYAALVRGGGCELAELAGPAAEDASGTRQELAGGSWDWLIVDHYGLDARWESELRQCAGRTLVIDDLADRNHDCDVLLDQNVLSPGRSPYADRVPQDCRLLLGPGYALLRKEFSRLREASTATRRPVRRLLILMGGMDASNETEKAIRALARIPGKPYEVDVVVGGAHPAIASVRAASERSGFRCHVQSADVAALMAAADLAIGGCGTTSWERCCLGLPAITMALAANQEPIAQALATRGAILHLGKASEVDEGTLMQAILELSGDAPRLAKMSAAARELVDGHGAERVCDILVGKG